MSSTRPVFVQYFEIVLKTLCSSNRINGDMQWNTTYIPKTDQPSFSQIEDFRSIAVLNVQEKLSCSLISKRLEKHIIANINSLTHLFTMDVWEKLLVPGNICLRSGEL